MARSMQDGFSYCPRQKHNSSAVGHFAAIAAAAAVNLIRFDACHVCAHRADGALNARQHRESCDRIFYHCNKSTTLSQ